jgi:hypothetical protein
MLKTPRFYGVSGRVDAAFAMTACLKYEQIKEERDG